MIGHMTMNEPDQDLARAWVERWKLLGPELEKLRRAQLPQMDTIQAMLALSDASESALRRYSPLPTSGLVEQQALLHGLHR